MRNDLLSGNPTPFLRVRLARTSLGLTQAALGAVLDVHPLTVSKWERGWLTPSDRVLAIVAALEPWTLEEVATLGERVRRVLASGGGLRAFAVLLGAIFVVEENRP